MDADRATREPVELRCYLCEHELIGQVRTHEGGLDLIFVCPIHGTRGTNEIFNPRRTVAVSS